jgi:hypothetical protein
MLALTSPTSGGRSVCVVRWRTLATEFFLWLFSANMKRENEEIADVFGEIEATFICDYRFTRFQFNSI